MDKQTPHTYSGYLEEVRTESLETRVNGIQKNIAEHKAIIAELEQDLADHCAELRLRYAPFLSQSMDSVSKP